MKNYTFKQSYHINYYTLTWILAFFFIVYLYYNWHIDTKLLGIVERKSHSVGAQESGKIQHVRIQVGDQVKKDQVLALLEVSDLEKNLVHLNKELTQIREMEDDQRDRFAILLQSSALQLNNEASDLVDRLSVIEAKNTELAGLNAEIARLKAAEQAGLGYSRDMSELVLQRDALAAYLREQSKDLNSQTQQIEKTRRLRKFLDDADMDSLSKSMFLDQMQYTESLERQVTETEYRILRRTITAPCDGFVTEIVAHAGDVVAAYATVLKIEELKPRFVDVFIPEKSGLQPEIGMKVDFNSPRNNNFDTQGEIVFVHPGIVQASERLSFRGQVFWARKARVELPTEHFLLPGETVTARIQSGIHQNNSLLMATTMTTSGNSPDGIRKVRNIEVPAKLSAQTRFEPSGITWLADNQQFLIVSDDTGIKNTTTDHAPYLFTMNESGKVAASPVILRGIQTINDLEAITPAGENIFYLVSSQNVSKKDKRPENRELIIKMQRDGENFTVPGSVHFLSLLLKSYSTEKLRSLGLNQFEKDGKPELNIEGAAFFQNDLYLGLKEPVSARGAFVWKIDNPDFLFSRQPLLPDQVSLFGSVDLGTFQRKPAGISDLIFDSAGVLWILSTIPGAKKDEQQGGLHRIHRFVDGRLEAEEVLSFPGLKPEGICLQDSNTFLIVFDNDEKTPAFYRVNKEDL